ncbi:hypothetical protein DRJ25_04650 [Candidatus Woesearchaeota archaeon]|nr:MAG: hypothetical protein DRJ25_04650 [Candidatus Woesearchaeota archaeon]
MKEKEKIGFHTVLNIGHRGNSALWHENTRTAFQQAVKDNVDMVETDARLTKDGVIVLMHNLTLMGLCGKFKFVRNLTFNELQHYLPEIMTLNDFLNEFKDSFGINIEIKSKERNIEKPVLDLLDKYGLKERVIISSFDYAILERVRRFDKKVKIGMLFRHPFAPYLEKGKELDAYAIHPFWALCNPELIKKCHKLGFKVYTWPVPRRLLKRYVKMGVDGIMTNYTHVLKNILNKGNS